MLAVVKAPRTSEPTLEIRGSIPQWMLSRLKTVYGRNLVVKDDPEELVDVFQTDWFARANSKMAPGDSIRIYRENFGFSQAELGSKLGGVPRQNVSAMERGHRGISKDMAKRLSKVFSVPVARFL